MNTELEVVIKINDIKIKVKKVLNTKQFKKNKSV